MLKYFFNTYQGKMLEPTTDPNYVSYIRQESEKENLSIFRGLSVFQVVMEKFTQNSGLSKLAKQ